MITEPVLFDSTMLETANEAFLFCKASLEKKEHPSAQRLEGLEPINTTAMGRLALRALYDVRPSVEGAEREYVDIAIQSLSRAVAVRQLSAVA
jgi:hypothetical protein